VGACAKITIDHSSRNDVYVACIYTLPRKVNPALPESLRAQRAVTGSPRTCLQVSTEVLEDSIVRPFVNSWNSGYLGKIRRGQPMVPVTHTGA
jgi:hypothetical protein